MGNFAGVNLHELGILLNFVMSQVDLDFSMILPKLPYLCYLVAQLGRFIVKKILLDSKQRSINI